MSQQIFANNAGAEIWIEIFTGNQKYIGTQKSVFLQIMK